MKKNLIGLVTLCTSVVALGISAPAQAEMGKNSIGPSLAIGGGTSAIGIDSKFNVNENLSIRPFIYIPSGGTVFGSALTYDFSLPNPASKVQITPFVGGGVSIASANNVNASATTVYFTGGADFDVSETIQLKAALAVPLTSGQSSNVTLGAGYRF
jgi:opacity protein-like surface antigen